MTASHKIVSLEMLQALAARCDASGFIALPDFIETALYHPTLGYYRQDRQRVGRNRQADFYTASTLREPFARAAIEASLGLLAKAGLDPQATDWVEIGAEPDAALLSGFEHPFRSAQTIRIGEAIELSGQIVVFSNELFDAQPFRQVRFVKDAWQEFGLRVEDDALIWSAAPANSLELDPYLRRLPPVSYPGYIVDLPTGADALLRSVAEQDWRGAFVAFDYGKSWMSLVSETPQGTARSYLNHQLVPEILANPGQQDITHHVCWDFLEEALAENGFEAIALESQESFIARRAPNLMADAFSPERTALDPLRGQLKKLIHPAHMGQKFQALSAIR